MDITVTYSLDDTQVKRLKAAQEAYKAKGYDSDLESLFNGLMLMGSKFEIDKKLDYAEKNAAGIGNKND